MLRVIKLVNVSYKNEKGVYEKVRFETVCDDVAKRKYYNVTMDGNDEFGVRDVDMVTGNRMYMNLLLDHPDANRLVILDDKLTPEPVVKYKRVGEHFEVTINGVFFESCDNAQELDDALARAQGDIHGTYK